MINERRFVGSAAIGIVLLLGSVCADAEPEKVPVQSELSSMDADGTLHIRDLTMPPSRLWSPEFREFYARYAQTVAKVAVQSRFQAPARHAPRAEWEKFFDAWDGAYYAEPLAKARERYPVDVVDTQIAGVRVGIVSPKNGIAPENRRRVLLNLRGGGFVYNQGLSFGLLDSIPVASIGRMKVITIDYRQAPFHSYPAASEDVEAVYKQQLQQYEPEAIGIFGCSAGGVLTAQSVAWFQAKGLPRPGAIGISCSALTSAWSSEGGDSRIWISGLVPRNQLSEAEKAAWQTVQWYMEDADPADPRAYPGLSDAVLASFPPTLFLIGTRDFALSAAVVTHARFLKLGVDSSLYAMEGLPHASHLMAVGTPEAHDAYTYVARWFDRHLAR